MEGTIPLIETQWLLMRYCDSYNPVRDCHLSR
jgi:hypothetical protein